MEQGQYDLCIDDDKQVTRLTSHEWPSFEAGTKIVLRVVFEEKASSRVDYHCHFCGAVNDVDIGSIMDSLQRQAGRSINWWVCLSSGCWWRLRTKKSKMRSTISNLPPTQQCKAEHTIIRSQN